MNFEIICHKGLGELRFGHSPEKVRSILKSPFESFNRAGDSEPCDHFTDLHLFVYYGENGVEAMEMAKPAKAMLEGIDLLHLGFNKLTKWLRSKDSTLVIEDDGCTSTKFGIGTYAPHAVERPDLTPESVIVFAKGYYD